MAKPEIATKIRNPESRPFSKESGHKYGNYAGWSAGLTLSAATVIFALSAHSAVKAWMAPVSIPVPAAVKLMSSDFAFESAAPLIDAPTVAELQVQLRKFKKQTLGVKYSVADLNAFTFEPKAIPAEPSVKVVEAQVQILSEREIYKKLTTQFYALTATNVYTGTIANVTTQAEGDEFIVDEINPDADHVLTQGKAAIAAPVVRVSHSIIPDGIDSADVAAIDETPAPEAAPEYSADDLLVEEVTSDAQDSLNVEEVQVDTDALTDSTDDLASQISSTRLSRSKVAKNLIADPNVQVVDVSSIVKEVRQEIKSEPPGKPQNESPQPMLADAAQAANDVPTPNLNVYSGTQVEYSDLIKAYGLSNIKSIDELTPAVNTQPEQAPMNTQPTTQVNTQESAAANSDQGPVAVISINQGKITVTPAAGAPGPQAPQPTQAPQAPIPPQAPVSTSEASSLVSNMLASSAATHNTDEAPDNTQSAKATSGTVGFSGSITEAFSNGNQVVANATLQVLGSTLTTRTDANGQFTFADANVEGVLPVIVSADGYLWRRAELRAGRNYQIELLSENSARMLGIVSGEVRPVSNGVFFGQFVDPTSEAETASDPALAGMTVKLVSIASDSSDQPMMYLNENGAPDSRLTTTTSRGQFVFSNVRPGTYFLVTSDSSGRERAPHVVHVGEGEGIVRRLSLGTLQTISGTVYNGATEKTALPGTQVQVLGGVTQASTDQKGQFTIGPMFLDCDELNYLQFDRQGFYRNRANIQCGRANQHYIFPQGHVDAAALDAGVNLNSHESMVMGHVSFNQPVRMQLLGPEEVQPAQDHRGYDFYFDHDGLINPAREKTANNGNFTIMNAPSGLSYIQAFNSRNRTLSIYPILTAPSTVNVHIQ